MKEHRKPIIFAGHILHLTDSEIQEVLDKYLDTFNKQNAQKGLAPVQYTIAEEQLGISMVCKMPPLELR